MLTYFVLFAVCVLISSALTRWVRDFAHSRGWALPPRTLRHIHTRPVPRLGGVAIFGCLVIVAFVLNVRSVGGLLPVSPGNQLLNIVLPGALVFGIGLLDDFYPVSPYLKLAVEILAALLLYITGTRISHSILLFGDYHFGHIVSLALTVAWVLLITNSFNLIDGLDGLAAGSALCSTLSLFVVSLVGHRYVAAAFTVAIAGSLVGFLQFNFSPATIFLGDCGSLFTGFMLSALAIQSAEKAPTFVAVLISSVAFSLPVLDTLLAIVRRFLRGQPLFNADRDHIHHRLLQRGLSPKQVAGLLCGVSAVFGLLGIFSVHPTASSLAVVAAIMTASVLIGMHGLRYPEVRELSRLVNRVIDQKRIIANDLEIRRAIERLQVCNTEAELHVILGDAFRGNDFDAVRLRYRAEPRADFISKHRESAAFRFDWSNGSVANLDSSELWTLTIDLTGPHGARSGELIVYRQCRARPVLLDINIITTELRSALCNAMDRTVHHPSQTFVSQLLDTGELAAGA